MKEKKMSDEEKKQKNNIRQQGDFCLLYERAKE
jgi:hypothetical protein